MVKSSLRKTRLSLFHSGTLKKDIIGTNNNIEIKNGCHLYHLTVRVRGNDNTLIISEDCVFGSECSIWMEGSGIKITIGEGSTFVTR